MRQLIWRLRYTLLGHRAFGWRCAWMFSGEWLNPEHEWDLDGLSPEDAYIEDIQASL